MRARPTGYIVEAMANDSRRDDDDYMRHYLAEADLSALDLAEIDLQADVQAERSWQWMRVGFALVIAAALVWVINTDYYAFHGHGTALVPIVWLALIASLVSAGIQGFGLSQGLRTPDLHALRHRLAPGSSSRYKRTWQLSLSATLQRYLLLGTGLGLGGLVMFYLPQEAEWQGGGYSGQWFLTVGAALVAGIALGRWLIAQAAHAQATAVAREAVAPFVWPPWFKWVTLSLLAAGALFATFGHLILGNGESSTVGFEMSGVGLFVGICGAIWIARRFDEWEADFKKQATRERDLP